VLHETRGVLYDRWNNRIVEQADQRSMRHRSASVAEIHLHRLLELTFDQHVDSA
jgi:hypothetical protein